MSVTVLNRKTARPEELAGSVHIGSGTVLGNPFKVQPYGPYSRGEAAEAYRAWLEQLPGTSPQWLEIARLVNIYRRTRKLALDCFCKPEPCHGDVLADIIENRTALIAPTPGVVAVTGHRPDKLSVPLTSIYSDEQHNVLTIFWRDLWLEVSHNVSKVIVGGALGTDMAAGFGALDADLPVKLVLPHPKYSDRWSRNHRIRLEELMRNAAEVVYVADEDEPIMPSFQRRNEAMVNEADIVIACWDGSYGGTANCLGYATKIAKPVTNVYQRFIEFRSHYQDLTRPAALRTATPV